MPTTIDQAIQVLQWLRDGKEVEQYDPNTGFSGQPRWTKLMYNGSFPQIQNNKDYRLAPPKPREFYMAMNKHGKVIAVGSHPSNMVIKVDGYFYEPITIIKVVEVLE